MTQKRHISALRIKCIVPPKNMKIFALSIVLASVLAFTTGLKCMTCDGASSFEECDVSGTLEECRMNQKSCETTVRRHNDRLTISKGCKDTVACNSNSLQNYGRSGKSRQCNEDQTNSVCTCCCDENLCNAGAPSCVVYYKNTGPVNDCPPMPQNFPHGEIECHNDNRAGSVCEYRCTDKDYSVYPTTRNSNVCRGNGSWAGEQPCCARPCPPYFLYDDVFLYHFSGKDAEESFNWTTASGLAYGVTAEDSVKQSALYFGAEPVESSVIKFNEYGTNATMLTQLGRERINSHFEGKFEGPSNAARAIRYALDHLFTPEAGMRDERVPKGITIMTDRDWDDDTKDVADEARSRGILMFAFLIKSKGYEFNHQKVLDFAGEEDHIFKFDIYSDNEAVWQAQMADVIEHFCQDPCEHVLHDHL